jgi:hypothetical protein
MNFYCVTNCKKKDSDFKKNAYNSHLLKIKIQINNNILDDILHVRNIYYRLAS